MCDLDAPGVRDRPEDPLALVVAWWLVPADTTDVTVVSGRELLGSPFRGAPVDERQLEPLVLPARGEISKQELDGLRLRGRGGDDPAGEWQAGGVDRHDALRTVGVAVGSAAAMEDNTTIEGFACMRPSARAACAWSSASTSAHVPLRDQRRNWDQTRVHGPNSAGRKRH